MLAWNYVYNCVAKGSVDLMVSQQEIMVFQASLYCYLMVLGTHVGRNNYVFIQWNLCRQIESVFLFISFGNGER